ncbi:TetR/AcrR family transcriptional regulator [Archangium lansingense]|uniref:TetR/AcrR family transcriptional regulator n=1 Tax=Archangium lansingense TaxID=2995310 RepID=UPI003B7D41A1
MPRIDAPSLAEHREATWKRLRDSFLEAMAEEGYGALTLASVARRAGIARNTIYNYAPTKDALLVAVVKAEVEPFVAQLVQEAEGVDDPEERLALVVRRQLAAFAPGARSLPVVNTMEDVLPEEVSTSIASCFAPVLSVVGRIVEQGISAGVFRPVADIGRVVEMMVGVMAAARRAITLGDSLDVIAAETTEFLVGGLRLHGEPGSSRSDVGPRRKERKR